MAVAWSCSLHVDDVAKNVTNATRAFAAARRLGCQIVRTDVAWKDLEPQRNNWSTTAADFYTQFFFAMGQAGLSPFVVLSGAPDWAKNILKSNRSLFFKAAYEYASRALPMVVSNSSARPLRVQLWNELNHIPSLWVRSSACGLLTALGRAARRAHLPGASNVSLWVNVMADDPLWQASVDAWVAPTCARPYIDGIGIDHYPGTWTLGAWDDWGKLATLLRRVSAPSDSHDPWSGLRAAVLETGFSSWSRLIASEEMQAKWVNTSLPALFATATAAAASANHTTGTPAALELVNWYEMIDGKHKAREPVPEEAHFGVMRWSSLEPKPAFAPLAAQMRRHTRR